MIKKTINLMNFTNFQTYLQNRSFAFKTITRHQREVTKYQNWLALNHHQTPEAANKKQLLNYLQHIKQSRALSNDSQNNILKILKNYYKYLAANYDVPNITAFIKIRGLAPKKLQALFTADELDLLCDAYYYHTQEYQPSKNELSYYPNYDKILQGRYIALTLIAYQGLQIQEVERITKQDFNFRKATIKIHSSKLAAARTLPLDASQIGVIMQFFACAERSRSNETQTIIPSRNQLENLSKTLKTLTLKPSTSITKYQDLTQIRASKIVHWIKQYGLRKAQHLAGHKSITATEKYLANNIEALQNDFNNFHPLN